MVNLLPIYDPFVGVVLQVNQKEIPNDLRLASGPELDYFNLRGDSEDIEMFLIGVRGRAEDLLASRGRAA
jgi:hypothetical protein